MLVLQNEVIGYIERLLSGCDINDKLLGVDVIRSAGFDGTFLAEMHTVKHFHSELWFPEILDRQYWSN